MLKLSILALLFSLAASAAPARGSEGLTPLHRAAGEGDTARVARLLEEGADVLALDSRIGVSVLHKAIYSGNGETVALLLEKGALINLQSPSNGDTPLHDAIYFRRGKDLSVIQALLRFHPSLAIQNRAGLTPLAAAKLLHQEDVARLLEFSEAGRQSAASRELMAAVRKNDLCATSRLAKEAVPTLLAEKDEQGFTPLLWAAREGFAPIVGLLLERGADPNQNDEWMGANAGHKAAFWGRAEVMNLLVSHGLNLNARGLYNGYTPLHDAVSGSHYETAEVLVRAGADHSLRGHDGRTPLDVAKANGDRKMVELLSRQ